jgi:mRNA interferase MazF
MTPPRRGEVWLVDLGMAAKVRPALVISIPAEDTDRALVTLVPHTTSPRQSRFEAAVSVSFLRAGVFDAQNLVTIPHAKLIRSFEKLGGTQLASVERAVSLWLGAHNQLRGITIKWSRRADSQCDHAATARDLI